jgi:hypothetical protein
MQAFFFTSSPVYFRHFLQAYKKSDAFVRLITFPFLSFVEIMLPYQSIPTGIYRQMEIRKKKNASMTGK